MSTATPATTTAMNDRAEVLVTINKMSTATPATATVMNDRAEVPVTRDQLLQPENKSERLSRPRTPEHSQDTGYQPYFPAKASSYYNIFAKNYCCLLYIVRKRIFFASTMCIVHQHKTVSLLVA